MSSSVIYARVPDVLKEAADAYANARGGSLTKAVAELLDRGLTAVSDEHSLGDLEARLERLTTENARLVSEVQTARAELLALTTLSQRANTSVGTCPNPQCGQPITGYDLLGTGQCRHCANGLTSLVAPAGSTPTLDQRQVMMLLGALGAVLGIAYLAKR
jgi:hypothetical protein